MKAKKKRVGSLLCFGAPPVTDENNEETGKERGEKSSNRRTISKIAKSISFISNSSNRSAKLPKDSNHFLSREPSESSSNHSACESLGKNLDSAIFSSSLSSSSSSSSSSCLSFDAAASAPEPRPPRKQTLMPPPAPENNGYVAGLCLLLVSLFVMVFCGRLCAILWTATWLCLVPRRRMVPRSPEFSDAVAAKSGTRPRGDTGEEEKRRVVLEGFLQRNGNKLFDLKTKGYKV